MGGKPWPQTGATQCHAQLGLYGKSRAIRGLVVWNNRELEPLDLQNGLALECYQPSPEVLIVLHYKLIKSVTQKNINKHIRFMHIRFRIYSTLNELDGECLICLVFIFEDLL